jgi:hypothetical protein
LWAIQQTSYFVDTTTNKTTEIIVEPKKIYNFIIKSNDEIFDYYYNTDNKCFIMNEDRIISRDDKYFKNMSNNNSICLIKLTSKNKISYEYFYYTGGENEKVRSVFQGIRIKKF